MDKWEMLLIKLQKFVEELKFMYTSGQISKDAYVMQYYVVGAVYQMIKEVEEAERDFDNTVSGSGG